jgi:hypothetical protein
MTDAMNALMSRDDLAEWKTIRRSDDDNIVRRTISGDFS